MITDKFLVIAGSVTGYRHRQTGKNNQDGYSIRVENDILAAVICDGCSASAKSEVGAKLISSFITAELIRMSHESATQEKPLDIASMKESILRFIRSFVVGFPSSISVIDEMFLFTIIGVVINELTMTIFSLGDGVLMVNGQTEIISENNSPNYLGYLVYPGSYEVDEKNINFIIRREMLTKDLASLVIASDGAIDLINKADYEFCILGTRGKTSGPEQFITEERYAKNPALLQKRLFQLNSERTSIDWEAQEKKKFEGIMSDDTTLVVVKRR